MEFKWEDDPRIGYYRCSLLDDGGKEMSDIYFWDYTSEFHKKDDTKNGYERPYAFMAGYCHGWSMDHGFDYDDQYDKHYDETGRIIGGYQGVCTHTVEDVKHWCEEFLASLYIIDFNEELEKLKKRAEISRWFTDRGYHKMDLSKVR